MNRNMRPGNQRGKVLIVGGAGYVGSAACAWLKDQGHEISIIDDLTTGRRELLLSDDWLQARIGDRAKVLPFLERGKFDCVMHFAARSLVGESVQKPKEYFENNVEQTSALLDMMEEVGTRRFIFSSTCAIFGDPGEADIHEDLPKKPVNPYGETKLEVERMLQARVARGLQSVALRYFNAAGAEVRLRVGEWHQPETHLIPRILAAALAGTPVEIYGTDYATRDGTCVRDYIHVSDLARAHEAAMLRLGEGSDGKFEAYNLGSETGFTVREVISAAEKVTELKLKVIEKPRRPGDPPRLVADSRRAREALGFGRDKLVGLEQILESAWQWERKKS